MGWDKVHGVGQSACREIISSSIWSDAQVATLNCLQTNMTGMSLRWTMSIGDGYRGGDSAKHGIR